jgi:hypothetical protein
VCYINSPYVDKFAICLHKHNNPAELGARQRVRKRDVSLQARTKDGIAAWDTFETLVCTGKQARGEYLAVFA